MIDQPGSIAQLALAVAGRRGTPVAYVPGLVMRRAADLYPGEAKTDRRDAYVLADTGGLAASRSTGWTPAPMSCSRNCGCSTGSTSTGRRGLPRAQLQHPQQARILRPQMRQLRSQSRGNISHAHTIGAYAEVQQDIRVLLDLEQVERALDHLRTVDRRLTADLKKHGGERASEIQTAIYELTDQEASSKENLIVLEGDLAILTEERESVAEQLRQHAGAASIQKERDRVAGELTDARSQRDAAITERTSLIATRGFLAFTDQLAVDTAERAAALYEKGALPAPLKREFVDKLLEDGQCICGTALASDTEAWHHVTGWRQRAGLQNVETAWQQLSGQVTQLTGARKELHDSLQSAVKRITAERDRVQRLEERMSELDGQLQGHSEAEVQQLESKRRDLDGRIRGKSERIGALRAAIEQIR